MKLVVVLLALLLAAMAMVPIVRTAETFPAETRPDWVKKLLVTTTGDIP
jgi:hypothetical protein